MNAMMVLGRSVGARRWRRRARLRGHAGGRTGLPFHGPSGAHRASHTFDTIRQCDQRGASEMSARARPRTNLDERPSRRPRVLAAAAAAAGVCVADCCLRVISELRGRVWAPFTRGGRVPRTNYLLAFEYYEL